MRSHLGVLALEKPAILDPKEASGGSNSSEKGATGESGEDVDANTPEIDNVPVDTMAGLRINKPTSLAAYGTRDFTESRWLNDDILSQFEEPDDDQPTPQKLHPVNWRAVLRHTSVIIAIPLFTFVMATLYTRGLFRSDEPPGTWLLVVRQCADQDWCFHAIVVLFFLAAILMVGKQLTYGFYVLSVAWSVLFIRNL